MKTTSGSNIMLRLCCYVSLAISFLPMVDYYCPWYITVLPVALALFITFQINRNAYPLFIGILMISALWVLICIIVYREMTLSRFINFYISFIPCMLAIQISRTVGDKRFFESYLKILAIFVSITCVTTMVGLETYPMASRELASGTAIYDTARYTKANIGGYDFIYALVLLIPIFFWMIKQAKGFWKVAYITALVLDILCIYASQYTTALICVVVALIIMWAQKDKKSAGIFTGVLIVFVLLNGLSLLSEFFYWASTVIGQEYTSDRLLQVSQLLSGQKIDTETSTDRIDYYTRQIEAFLTSPIWGHNLLGSGARASGHTLVLDVLGGVGILGFIPMVWFGKKLYRLAVNLDKKPAPVAIKVVWTMGLIVAILNPIIFPTILTVAFMGCMCINKVETSEEMKKIEGRIDGR
ncbi:MAG: hypothetical protein J6Q92_03470 [Oscillospiraceae bacterium]|nr:hypothetical protein [Oscillospiraceae bacterium]